MGWYTRYVYRKTSGGFEPTGKKVAKEASSEEEAKEKFREASSALAGTEFFSDIQHGPFSSEDEALGR